MYRLEGDGFVILEQPNLHLNWLFDHFFWYPLYRVTFIAFKNQMTAPLKRKKHRMAVPVYI